MVAIKDRDVKKIGLIISDNLTGLDSVVPLMFKNAAHQKCVVHLKLSILNKVASKHKEQIAEYLKEVINLDTIDDTLSKAFKRLDNFFKQVEKIL